MRYALLLLLLVAACAVQPCEQEDGLARTQCFVALAAERADATLCEGLADPYDTWCLTGVAAATGDRAVCDAITDGRAAAFCARDLIIEDGAVAECASLGHDQAADDCYNAFARAETTWEHCLDMTRGSFRDECLYKVSRAADDPYGCAELDDGYEFKTACIYTTSVASRNAATCEWLDDEDRRYCLLNIQLAANEDGNCAELPEELQDLCERVGLAE